MSILGECPVCQRKQSNKNKACVSCGNNMDKSKRSRKVRFWINFRLPGGKQRREPVGYSIEEARDADGKRKAQKRENRIFDMLPESKMTFSDLAEWYLNQKSVKKLASFDRYEDALNNFTAVFGKFRLNEIKQVNLEDYQIERKDQGAADGTIDLEIKIIQSAVTKAFDNDMISGSCLKAFRKTKRLLEHGSNARKMLISTEQYLRLLNCASAYYKPVLIIAFNTGMRIGEIRRLKWPYVDKPKMMIRLPKDITKESRDKNIPINHHVKTVLTELPRSIAHDYVISYNGRPVKDYSRLRRQFENTCKKACIPYGTKIGQGIIFHDIRRSVKTNMVNAGIDKIHRDTIIGHSLKGMDAHYIVPTDESLTEAMGKYTKWLDDQLNFANVDYSVDYG
jgi:integrase